MKFTLSSVIFLLLCKFLSPSFWDHYWFHSQQIASVGLTVVISALGFIITFAYSDVIIIKVVHEVHEL